MDMMLAEREHANAIMGDILEAGRDVPHDNAVLRRITLQRQKLQA